MAVFTLSACSENKKDAPSSPKEPAPLSPSKSSSASAGSEEEIAKTEVLRAYDKFWDAQVAAYQKGSMKGAGVERYATAKALAFVDEGVRSMAKEGNRKRGKPSHKATVSKFTARKPGSAATATISDCLDTSSWKTVKKDSGKVVPLPSDVPSRFTVTTKAEDWGKRGWRMLEVTPTARKC
ncbi:hypothetical protein [Streptomyces smyrnaeus]|uniref:hypothetical protein n=1 Tax=Streptomyces smyrnaeus TaxID=1387713 RepID=UPI00117CCC0A